MQGAHPRVTRSSASSPRTRSSPSTSTTSISATAPTACRPPPRCTSARTSRTSPSPRRRCSPACPRRRPSTRRTTTSRAPASASATCSATCTRTTSSPTRRIEAARKEPIALIAREQPLNHVAAPYFVEHVRQLRRSATATATCSTRGLRIYTTLDMRKQRAAEAALRHGLEDLDRRLGFRGPIGHLDGAERDAFASGPPRPYVVLDGAGGAARRRRAPPRQALRRPRRRASTPRSAWSRRPRAAHACRSSTTTPRAGAALARQRGNSPWSRRRRSRCARQGRPRAGLVTHDEKKGDLAAARPAPRRPGRAGRRSTRRPATSSRWSAATTTRARSSTARRRRKRQVGSSIKPFIYATALEHGFTELSIVHDAPFSVKTATGIWAPHNYKRQVPRAITLQTALANSLNTVRVRLVVAIGVDAVIETMRKLGITPPIPRHISIALGTPDVTLLEHDLAPTPTFPAGGQQVTPRFITQIVDADGNVVEDWRKPEPRPAGRCRRRHRLRHDRPDEGRRRERHRRRRPRSSAARPRGKTGTSTNFRDAWFIGFTTDLLCGVWVGRDDFKPHRLRHHRRHDGAADLARLHAGRPPRHAGARLHARRPTSPSSAPTRRRASPRPPARRARPGCRSCAAPCRRASRARSTRSSSRRQLAFSDTVRLGAG